MIPKKIVSLIFLTSFTSSAFAVADGPYFGGQVGLSKLNNGERDVLTDGSPPIVTVKPKNTGVGARLLLGYSFNPYIGLEGGWYFLSPSIYDTKVPLACDDPRIREKAYDIVGKGTLPFDNGLGLYAKFGAALAKVSVSGRLSPDTVMDSCSETQGGTKIAPVVGFGVSYDFTQSWVGDVSWTRILKTGNIQSADLLALGISYHFVNKRCGQFLC